MHLSDKLKAIYSSGSAYTVIQLLEKFIEEVKTYEETVYIPQENIRVVEHVVTEQDLTSGYFSFDTLKRVATYLPFTVGVKRANTSSFVVYAGYSPTALTQTDRFDGVHIGESSSADYIDINFTGGNISAGDRFKLVYYEDVDGLSVEYEK